MKILLIGMICINILSISGCANKKVEYFENGNIRNDYCYNQGKKEGEFKIFYLNGKIKEMGNYNDDKLNGFLYEYDSLGILTRSSSYKYGVENGESIEYYSNGNIHIKGFIKDGNVEGLTSVFNENGTLKGIQLYKLGKIINQNAYDKLGNIIGTMSNIELKKEKFEFDTLINVSICFTNRMREKLEIYIGDLIVKNGVPSLIDTIQIIKTQNSCFDLKYKPKFKGINTISGIVRDISVDSNSFKVFDTYYFKLYPTIE